MILSCSRRAAFGGNCGSPKSQVESSTPHHYHSQPARERIPSFCSRPTCFNFPLFSSASQHHIRRRNFFVASLKPPSGKGFGKKNIAEKKSPTGTSEGPGSSLSLAQEDVKATSQNGSEEDDDDVVPEVVTNRMLKRIALTVGVPVGLGVLLFPLFYYLKVVNKVDVPEWLPLVVSMITFGTAGLGITYGVVSSSWDPTREGSLLGWKEAQVNWPLIWDKAQGNQRKK